MLSPLFLGSLTALAMAAPSAVPSSAPPSSVSGDISAPAIAVPSTAAISIDAPREVRVKRTAVFHAVTTDVATTVVFNWEFGDGGTAEGLDVTHVYDAPGTYDVTLRAEPPGAAPGERLVARATVVAAHRTISLFASAPGVGQEAFLRSESAASGAALHVVPIIGRSLVLQQENLTQLLVPELDAATREDLLVFTPPPDVALGALVALAQGKEGTGGGATIVLLTEGSPGQPPRLARIVAELLRPSRILLVPQEGLTLAVRTADTANLAGALRAAGLDVVEVDASTPGPPRWALLSQFTDLLLRRGVPAQSILLLLLLPVIIAVVVTLRQVVGLSTMGLTVPVMLALCFVLLGVLPGIALSVGVMLAAIGVRGALRRIRLLYLGRVGLATTIIAALVAVTLLVLPELPVFPILVLVLTTERTYGVLAERGVRATLLISLETVIVATVAAVVAVEWHPLQHALTAWPELSLVAIVVQLLVGRYTGLRASEILRFRDLLNEAEYGEEE